MNYKWTEMPFACMHPSGPRARCIPDPRRKLEDRDTELHTEGSGCRQWPAQGSC